MPWWQKSSKEAKKQGSKEVSSDGSQNRLHNLLRRSKHGHSDDDASSRKSRQSLDLPSEAESPRSPSPPTPSTRSPSFRDRPSHGPPLPLPCAPPLGRTQSGNVQLFPNQQVSSFPAHPSQQVSGKVDHGDVDGLTSGCGSGSGSSVSSIASAEQVGPEHWPPGVSSRISNLKPQHDGDIFGDVARPHVLQILQGSSVQQTPRHSRTNSRVDLSRPASPHLGSQPALNTPRRPPADLPHLQLHVNGFAPSAPDSSMSSPSRSPRRPTHLDQGPLNAYWHSRSTEAHGSNPGSGHNSAQNSSGGEVGLHLLSGWQRASPERSPILSPRLRSPGPGSRGQSAAASPFHPAVGGRGSDSPSWHDERMTAHPLPLPPPAFSNNSGYASPSQFSSMSPRPARTESARSDAAPNEWKKGKLIGSGTFGNVYVGFNSNTGRSCAMKEVLLVSDDSKSRESAKQLEQEIAMLSRFQHPNIVQYYASDFFEDKLYIYLEYVSGGSIHKLLQDYGAFKEPLICNYTRQILQGLAFLHSTNTVHRDIKGANILVNNDGEVKVADFGMAKHISIHQSTHSLKGTAYWMAPEVINQSLCVRGYDLAVDIWSLGCTVIEMATAKPPWSQYEGVAAMFKIGHTRELPQIPDLSDEAKDFIRACLKRNPAERPTAAQLLEHPFVKKAADDRVPGMPRPEDRLRGVDHVGALTKSMRPLNVGRGAGHRRVFSHDVESTSSPMLRGWPTEPFTSDSPRALGVNHQYQQRSPGHLFIAPVLSSGTMTPPGGAYGGPQVRPFAPAVGFPGDGYRTVPRSPNGLHARSTVLNGLVLEPRSSDKYRNTPGRTPEGSPRQDHHSREDIFSIAAGRGSADTEERHTSNGNQVDNFVSPQRGSSQPLPPRRLTSPVISRTSSHELSQYQ